MRPRAWRRFWFGALSILLAVEMWAVFDPATGDTLSEAIMPLLGDPLVWTGTLSAWVVFSGWLAFHFWFDREDR